MKTDVLDTIQVVLWSIAYLLMVVYGIKNKGERKVVMPLLAGSLNLAWEINALIVSGGLWGHIIWLMLDVVIVLLNLHNIAQMSRRIAYLLWIVVLFSLCRAIFLIPDMNGMLLSCFVIDLIMAIAYLANVKKVLPNGRIPIAITKLLGDLFAWWAYANDMEIIKVIGAVVFLLNLYYLSACMELAAQAKKRKRR